MSKITRTITSTVADILCLDVQNEKINHFEFTIPGKVEDKKAALRIVNKTLAGHTDETALPVAVKTLEQRGVLYGMEESRFLELATPADKRSPVTRGAITKEVLTYAATCMVCNSDFTVTTSVYPLPRKMDKEQAKRHLNRRAADGETIVVVKSIDEISGLYFLPVDEFIANAEVLPDRETK